MRRAFVPSRLIPTRLLLAAALGLAVTAAPVLAQRDPAYAAARASGTVGE